MTAQPHPHWEILARRWSHVGQPLRPSPQDRENFALLLGLPGGAPRRVLILGVTPELYRLPWPEGSVVRAADRSGEMIGAIWPGPPADAVQANWRDLPFAPGSFDCVLCDGGLHLLSYPAAQQELPASLARMLQPGGQFVIRLFALPDKPESPADVLSELRAGKMHNIHGFKLRLGMSMQSAPPDGVALREVYATVMREFGSLDGLQSAIGWPRDEVQTLTSYEQSPDRYHFLTRAESVALLESGGHLEMVQAAEGDYPLGERCPVIAFRKASAS